MRTTASSRRLAILDETSVNPGPGSRRVYAGGMATTEAPANSEQATEEFVLRVKRTGMQVVGAFVLVAAPLLIAGASDGITYDEAKAACAAGVTAAIVWVLAALQNYFKPLQTNP